MHYYDMVQLTQANQEKLTKEAEQHRLANGIQRSKNTQLSYASLMVKVGEVLSEIGDSLQTRYGEWEVNASPITSLIENPTGQQEVCC